MTKTEVELQLAQVNAAIEQLLLGKRLSRLEIGSGTDRHVYEMTEITLESLRDLQKELLDFLNTITPVTPTFNLNSTIPLIIKKDIF